MSISQKLKVQLVSDDGNKWKYVGNGFKNSDGSISVYLDKGVTLTGGQKLHIRPAWKGSNPDAAPDAAEGAKVNDPDGGRRPAKSRGLTASDA